MDSTITPLSYQFFFFHLFIILLELFYLHRTLQGFIRGHPRRRMIVKRALLWIAIIAMYLEIDTLPVWFFRNNLAAQYEMLAGLFLLLVCTGNWAHGFPYLIR